MRLKKKIMSIMMMLVPLLITIGFSAWIIIYEFSFSPDYQTLGVLSDYFDTEQSTTYNASEQIPLPKDGVSIDLSNATYSYRLSGVGSYQDGKPINAGVYDVIIKKEDYGQCQIKYTINKKVVRPSTNNIALDYNSSYTSWAAFQTVLYNNISYLDEQGNIASELGMANCYILGMHNGQYYYGNVDNSSSYTLGTSIGTDRIIGSTYQAVITMADGIKDNYTLINNRLIIKYKTAKVSGVYYTIEEAITNTSGTITFEGNLSNTSFVATSFCNLTKQEGNPYNNTFNISSRTMIVPYEASTTDHTTTSTPTSSGSVYSSLIIPSSVTLNVSNGSTLTAAAFIGFSQPKTTISCNRGVIMNYGTINVESGGSIKSYGYIKGTGTINLKSGSSALDCMTTYDWPGGTAGSKMYKSVMPTNAWSLHNISCETIINAGATYSGYIHVIMSKTAKDATSVILGNTSSSNCIFKLTSGFIRKSTIKANNWNDNHESAVALNTIVGSNQIAGQRDIIEINGVCEDGVLSISMKVLITVTMQSSTSIPAPISFMNVIVKSGSTITLSKSDYMFLPGSSLLVESGAEMIINANVDVSITTIDQFSSYSGSSAYYTHCVDKQDASCIINGKLTINNGSLGGLIQTTEQGAVLNLSSASSLSSSFVSMYSTADPYYFLGSCTVNGNVKGANGNFEQKVYISYETTAGQYGWNVTDNVTIFTLKFYDYSSKELFTTSEIYVINDSNGNASYVVTGDEYSPTKMHYDFSKWVDSSGNDLTSSLNNGSIVLSNLGTTEYSLYASWSEHQYSFSYSAGFKETTDSEIEYITENVTFNNSLNTFTISDFVDGVLTITTTATYNTCKFYGWYVGIDTTLNIQISSITISQLEKFVSSYGDTIPLFCYFSNIITYEIIYSDNNNEITDPERVNVDQGNTIPFPNEGNSEYDNYENDTSKQWYFYGWYADSSFTIPVDSSTSVENYASGSEDTTITLYGKWIAKTVITFQYKNFSNSSLETIEDPYYVKPGNTLYTPIGINFTKIDDTIGNYNHVYTFRGWYLNNSAYTSYVATEDDVTFVAHYDVSFYCFINISLKNASVEIGGVSYSDGSKVRIDLDSTNNQNNVTEATNPTSTFTITVNISYNRYLNKKWSFTTGGEKSTSGSKEDVSITGVGNSSLSVSSGLL